MSKLTEIKEFHKEISKKEGFHALCTEYKEDVSYLLYLLDVAVKALEWYADSKNYIITDNDLDDFLEGGYAIYPVLVEAGNQARSTLKRIKGENE